MEPKSIKTRIAIGEKEQGDIAFIYDFNLLKKLNVQEDKEFNNSYFLDIGTENEFEKKNIG